MKAHTAYSRLIFLITSVFMLLTGCKQHPPVPIILANYLVEKHLTTSADSVKIAQLIDTLLARTQWNGRVRINRAYDSAAINLYIINSDYSFIRNDKNLQELINKCGYIGYKIIFVDDAYLNAFLGQHHVPAHAFNQQLLSDADCFIYWVVGHELGHLVCGHLQGHFDSDPLDKFVKSSTINNLQELQADSFFVSAMQPDTLLRISEESLMLDILNAEIENKVGKIQTYGAGLFYDYTNKQVVNYAQQPTHPEYVVRLSRMLELSGSMSRDTGLYNLINGFARQLKEVKK